jgi:glycosyltransferase involved in cell wall biosynthesis
MAEMRALYVSHNGMLEPLGQSQVLPYLRGLAKRGIEFDLLSYELPESETDAIEALRAELLSNGIRWWPMRRARDPRLQVKVREAARGVLHAITTAARRRPQIVHGRGYLPTAVGDAVATALPGAKLLFDCRGMLGDEYVDGGYWTEDRLEYKILKRYEARAFRRSEGVVVLTHALRQWLLGSGWLGPNTRIETIPCCVDFERFRFDPLARARVRRELGLKDHIVLVYSGSLGGLYREADLARFAGILKRRTTRPFAFLVLTPSSAKNLVQGLHAAGIRDEEILIRKVPPKEMGAYLSAGDAATAFGKSCFARMGCSPTKLAEYFACGLPSVVNDFGDQAEIAKERETCVMVDSFEDDALVAAADRLLAMANAPIEERVRVGRRVAEARFDLEHIGISRYEALYRALAT